MSEHKNKVELIGVYGDDWSHACSAWTSTSRNLSEDKKGRMPKLLKQLAEAGHHTPFEKSSLHFLVTTDIATHIHLLKHRVGVSINGESARYKELKEDKYYIPQDWPEELQESLAVHNQISNSLYHNTIDRLVKEFGFDRARAKESARFFKPYSMQYEADVMFNFRSFHHFLGLRYKPDAQKEIHDVAGEMLDLVRGLKDNPFEHTLKAFGYG